MTKYKIIYDLKFREHWAPRIQSDTFDVLLGSEGQKGYAPRSCELLKNFGDTSSVENKGLVSLVRFVANKKYDKSNNYPTTIKIKISTCEF